MAQKLKGDDFIQKGKNWIDFKELRSQLVFSDVLRHYQVQLKDKGERATGFCPLPTHEGQRRSPSFSASLTKGIWQCFGCGAKGNVLDFCCRMEGFDPVDSRALRQAALMVRDIFRLNGNAPKLQGQSPEKAAMQTGKQVLVNAPIDFELRSLDPKHPYLFDRGFTPSTIEYFGLGFCNRGMLKGRIAIPLHDPQGRLVGYAGRITRDEQISEKCPKYLFPGDRERDGVLLEFRKSLLLYNAHRIKAPVDHLFVVEGFPAAWWLHQAEYRNVVAVMGSHCSEEQARLIINLVKPDGRVWAAPDGNEAGTLCARSILEQVSPHRFARWVKLGEDEQPTDISADELAALLV